MRHKGNQKMFAAICERMGNIWVNVKCDPEVLRLFHHQPGIYPAYHMNRNHWLTAVLDGRVDDDTMAFLLGISYDLTKGRKKQP